MYAIISAIHIDLSKPNYGGNWGEWHALIAQQAVGLLAPVVGRADGQTLHLRVRLATSPHLHSQP